jgi:TolB-like protein/Flp pilus assembly protein TadD
VRSRKRWIFAGSAVGVLGLALAILSLGRWPSTNIAWLHTAPASAPTAKSVETIAVLPFRDLSSSPDNEGWAIGITDAIISRLTSLKNLAVRPTTSVMKYAKESPDPTEAAKALGVSSVLEGTYQRTPEVVRVSVQLIDGATGTTKWSQRYDLRSADILTFEDEVAGKVVDGLQIQISPTEQKNIHQAATTNVDAYNDYLQARFHFNKYMMDSRPDDLENGERELQHAITLDSKFTMAYALLAEFYNFQAANFPENALANVKKGEESAKKALVLDPDSPSGLLSLGGSYTIEGRLEDAIPVLRRAAALLPNDPDAIQILSYTYYFIGMNDRAAAGYRSIRELNPMAVQPRWMYARMLLYGGHGDEAEKEMRSIVADYPNHFKALGYLAMVLHYQGKSDEAKAAADRALQQEASGDDSARLAAAFIYASRNERSKIAPKLFTYRPETQTDADIAEWMAGVYALLGDRQLALQWLHRAVELGLYNYPWFQRDKNLDSLRSDPDFQKLMTGVRQRCEALQAKFSQP